MKNQEMLHPALSGLGAITFGLSLIFAIPQEVSDIDHPPSRVVPLLISLGLFTASRLCYFATKRFPMGCLVTETMLFAIFVYVLSVRFFAIG